MATVTELDAAKQRIAEAKDVKSRRIKSSFDFYAGDGEIYLFGEIADEAEGGIDAGMVTRALKKIGNKPVSIFIDSPGGAVDTGIAIFNALESHKAGVTTIVSALAASIASVVLQAGQRRIIYSNSIVMVHSPLTSTRGNAAELRRTADLLDRYEERIVGIYTSRAGQSPERIRQMLSQETWLSGQEIIAQGFADSVSTKASRVAATARKSVAAYYGRDRARQLVHQCQELLGEPKRPAPESYKAKLRLLCLELRHAENRLAGV